MIPGFAHRRRFSDLSEQEVLALAISSEEDDFPSSSSCSDGRFSNIQKNKCLSSPFSSYFDPLISIYPEIIFDDGSHKSEFVGGVSFKI